MIKIPGPIPIFISPFFWIMAVIIGWLSTGDPFETLLWIGVIFVSVLFHEFGHALTAVGFGQRVLIELTGFGGLTVRNNAKPLSSWKEFLIGLNGPLAGFLLCGIAYLVLQSLPETPNNRVLAYVLTVAFYVNLYWTVINLLPVQPLDGGKLVRVALEGFFGVKGTKAAFILSTVLATVCGIAFFIMHSFLAGSIFFILAFEGYRDLSFAMKMTESDKDEDLQLLMRDAQQDMENGNNPEALEKFLALREKVKSGVIHDFATQFAGTILALEGEKEKAYELLSPMQKSLNSRGVQVLQHLAYDLGHYEQAAELGNKAFQLFPDYETALMNAYTHAKMGEVKPAIGWIQCAIREGIPDPANIFLREEFATISRDPQFQELKEKYARNGS